MRLGRKALVRERPHRMTGQVTAEIAAATRSIGRCAGRSSSNLEVRCAQQDELLVDLQFRRAGAKPAQAK